MTAQLRTAEQDLDVDPVMDLLHEYGIQLAALVLAVSHKQYLELPIEQLTGMLRRGGLLLDVKSALDPPRVGASVRYRSL